MPPDMANASRRPSCVPLSGLGFGSISGLGLGLLLVCAGTTSAMGCSPDQPPELTKTQAAPAPGAPKRTELKLDHLSERVEDPTFELELNHGGDGYKASELGHFVLTLTPRGEYHVNKEFPMQIGVRGPSELTFPKTELTREDAAEYRDRRARFDVPFTPTAAGEHRVVVDVDFAVCTDETCVPDRRKLALVLAVE